MNHDTGKSYKLDNEDISLMQERVSTLSWKRKMKK